MNVLLTGATGFVGREVLKALFAWGHRVRALVRARTTFGDDRVTAVVGSLNDLPALSDAAAGCDAAIHLVGIIRERRNATFHSVHVEGTRNVVQACLDRGVRRYVHMSALGTRPPGPGVSAYHRTKYEAEQIVRQSSLAWTVFRPSLIHGSDGEFVQQVGKWARGEAAPWLFMPYFGRGLLGLGSKALLQPVSVQDVARAFAEALTNPASVGQTYDLVGTQQVTWPEMYTILAQTNRWPAKPSIPIPAWYAGLLARCLPAALLPFNLSQVQMARMDNVGDPAPFQSNFGWTPAGLREAVQSTS